MFPRVFASRFALGAVRVSLITGRTHQIRGQLAAIGFPIVNDTMYGGRSSIGDGVCLTCKGIVFVKPTIKETVGKKGGRILKFCRNFDEAVEIYGKGGWWVK